MRNIVPCFLFLATSIPALATVDSGLLALVPAGTKIVSGIDVTRAKSSPFGQYLLGKVNTGNQGFEQMLQQTGFDPRRDVADVLFISGGPKSAQFGVLVRGNFDQTRIKNSLTSQGASVQSYQGVDILVEPSSHGKHAVAFPEVDIAVMGDQSSVQQIIANRANPSSLDPALQQLIANAGANQDAWFASLDAGSFLAGNFGQQATAQVNAQALQSILQSSGGVTFGDVVQLSFDAITRSPQDATSLVAVVRFGTSMVQMQRQKDPRASVVASSLDNLTLQASGSKVHVGLSIPESGMEQLSQLSAQTDSGRVRPSRQSGR